jgi:nitrite reductase (NO-forming)
MKRLATLVPFLIAAVVAGCGSSSSSSSSSTAAASSSTGSAASSASAAPSGGGGALTLNESEFKITPAGPKLAHAGEITITVKNTGAVTHALTVDTLSGPVSTGSIAPGKTTTLKVNIAKAGTYKFFCPIPGHEAAGMKGALVVA